MDTLSNIVNKNNINNNNVVIVSGGGSLPSLVSTHSMEENTVSMVKNDSNKSGISSSSNIDGNEPTEEAYASIVTNDNDSEHSSNSDSFGSSANEEQQQPSKKKTYARAVEALSGSERMRARVRSKQTKRKSQKFRDSVRISINSSSNTGAGQPLSSVTVPDSDNNTNKKESSTSSAAAAVAVVESDLQPKMNKNGTNMIIVRGNGGTPAPATAAVAVQKKIPPKDSTAPMAVTVEIMDAVDGSSSSSSSALAAISPPVPAVLQESKSENVSSAIRNKSKLRHNAVQYTPIKDVVSASMTMTMTKSRRKVEISPEFCVQRSLSPNMVPSSQPITPVFQNFVSQSPSSPSELQSRSIARWLQTSNPDCTMVYPVWIGNLPSSITISQLRAFVEAKVGRVLISIYIGVGRSTFINNNNSNNNNDGSSGNNNNIKSTDRSNSTSPRNFSQPAPSTKQTYAFLNFPCYDKQSKAVKLLDGQSLACICPDYNINNHSLSGTKNMCLIARAKRASKFPFLNYSLNVNGSNDNQKQGQNKNGSHNNNNNNSHHCNDSNKANNNNNKKSLNNINNSNNSNGSSNSNTISEHFKYFNDSILPVILRRLQMLQNMGSATENSSSCSNNGSGNGGSDNNEYSYYLMKNG